MSISLPASFRVHVTARLRPGLLPLACLVLVALVVGGSALHWIWAHPEVAGWDQIGYADELLKDMLARAEGGWGGLRDSLFFTSRHHPAGLRLLGVPLALAGLADMTTLRLLACGSMALTAWLVFATTRLVVGTGPARLAAAAFLLAPVTLQAAQDWMSEVLLMPALAGLMYCLAREARPMPPRWNPLWLGLCLGGGLLARLSFLPQVLPVLLVAAVALLLWQPQRLPRLLVVALVALLLAWPFWVLNGGHYIGYARYALNEWHTHEINPEGPLGYPGQWLAFVADWVFGPLLLLALVLGLVGLVARLWPFWRRPWAALQRCPGLLVLGFALLLAGPPLAGHFLATNHNPRFLLAALPGLAVALGFGATAWRGRLLPVLAGLLGGQALLLLAVAAWAAPPPLAGLRAAQARPALDCDWRTLLPHLPGAEPHLLLLGSADGFNQVQVRFAFHRSGRPVDVTETPFGADPVALTPGRDAVLALVAADTRDVEHYRGYFRQLPQSAEVRLALTKPAELAALLAAGFTDAAEVTAPGEGACHARLLLRAAP